MQSQSIDVLVIEDNASERESIRDVVRTVIPAAEIDTADDGRNALQLLWQRLSLAQSARRPLPRLILLDLRLPGVDGLALLQELRSHQELAAIPVVVFTDSDRADDIRKSYEHGANSFIRKPVSFDDFERVVGDIAKYWLLYNQPSRP